LLIRLSSSVLCHCC